MAERFDMVLALGTLATEAAQRGDDRAAETLRDAAKMLFADQAIDKRREWDRQRKKDKQRNQVESGGIGQTPVSSSEVFPRTPFPNSRVEDNDDTAREAAAAEAVYAESVDNLLGMLSQRIGSASWPDVDGFLKRRQYKTWKGWIKEMLSVLTGGTATIDDLAQVCRDDAALERQIGSPKGLRTFVASQARERTAPAPTELPRPRGGVAMRTYANGRDALRDLP